MAKRHRVLPLDFDLHNRRLTLAAADINDLVAIDKVRSQLPDDVEVETLLAGESEIDRAPTSTTATNFRSTASCTRSKPAKSISAACRPRPTNTASRSSA